ncbi:MAG: hypothetical protein U0271_39380 [Polyangiaceae bacterium]
MTRRSRSSFDLRDALSTAEALSPKPPAARESIPDFQGMPLVNFGGGEGSTPPSVAPAPPAPPAVVSAPAPIEPPLIPAPRSAVGALPPPPAVDTTPGLMPRLSLLLEWLRADREVTRALVVDDEGLPLIGSTSGDLGDAESLLAATGSVASAMKRLALATPGTMSPDFEGHVGDGPVLQLIGFTAAGRAYVVGISRKDPFGHRDVEAIRQAFTKALVGAVVGGRELGSTSHRGPSGSGSGSTGTPPSRPGEP